jgi:ABC-2 type transport system ATP-binding protein
MILTDNLTKRFGDVTAVSGLSLAVPEGELFGLVGSDGAGKTTTLRMLAAVLDPTSGSARVLGRETASEGEAIRHDIGYMSQRFGLYPDLTVDENLRFYADIFGLSRNERELKTEELLSFSRLTPFRKRQAGKLSGGMKQKLGLACALIHTPKLLLLDEPTNGVDPVSRRDFWRILHRLLRERVTIVVTTAYLDEAERCGRVGLLHLGRLLACDTPERLKEPLRGKVLELRPQNPRRALPALREALPRVSFTLFGERIHATAETGARIAADVERFVPGTPIREIEPTLEDVLVHAIEAIEGDR